MSLLPHVDYDTAARYRASSGQKVEKSLDAHGVKKRNCPYIKRSNPDLHEAS
jgi:hypothetical protein